MKVKISALDRLFSEYIRRRAMERVRGCERCFTYKENWKQLQCSHFYSRSRKSVRYDEDNAVGLCFGCHQYLGSHPLEHVEFFKKLLGDRFELLEGRMRQIGKPDKELLMIYFKAKIKEME
ncbi:hypothetical protein LCGC14_0420460 [marine sediment metagenome]|uniref:HNH domain-containing protein n=1 Tax=marine sediment metagenome TaxID=412755 RepID=A0A0F9T8Z7_9ZZZZ